MRFKAIDSLRGIAASLVVLYHEWNRFNPHASSQSVTFAVPAGFIGHALFFLFGYGYFGVSLFFVVSGFCIHLPQAYKHAAGGSDALILKKFAKRRFFRIYPAYFASLILTSLALCIYPALLSLVRHQPENLLQRADLPSLAINAVFLQQLWPRAFEFNGVYWTLLLEVQFYLCYPLLLWICRKIGFKWPLFILLVAECIFAVWPTKIPDLIFLHYFEWVLGMYMVERLANQRPLKIPFLAFPLLVLLTGVSVFHPATVPFKWLFAALASAALIANCVPDRENSILSNKWLVAIGVFSYSLYLVHIPVLDVFWNGTQIARKSLPALPVQVATLGIVFAFVVGYLFFLLFERPYLGETQKAQKLAPGLKEQAW
jgi:peptidoglycan/LPS O-acetylase OafA/YrhL